MSTLELLKSFCLPDDDPTAANTVRASLCSPWTDGEWTLATNGRVIVRVPRLDGVVGHEFAPHNTAIMFDEAKPDGQWVRIDSLKIPKLAGPSKCRYCRGKGCDDCDFTGQFPEKARGVEIGRNDASHLYLHKLLALPDAEICSSTEALAPFSIRFTGGEALLMPLRK